MFLLTILQWQKRGQHGLGELLLRHSLCMQMLVSLRVPGAEVIIRQMIVKHYMSLFIQVAEKHTNTLTITTRVAQGS